MTYLNIQTSTLRNEAFSDATNAQKGVWLTLMNYCAEQENGGRIRGVMQWSEIKVAKALGVAKNDLFETSPLWTQKGDDLEVEFYPREKQRIVQAKRKRAHEAAIARWAHRSTSDAKSDGAEASETQSDIGCNIGSDNGMRKGMEEKGREGKGISPLPPSGESAAEEVDGTTVGSEVAGDDEVVAWAAGWGGELARGIPAGIPEAYVLNWIAWRHELKAGPWPRDWQADLVRRFKRDWLSGDPRARGVPTTGSGRPERLPLFAEIKALEQELATHRGNPANNIGSAAAKKAAGPDFDAKTRRLRDLKQRVNGGEAIP